MKLRFAIYTVFIIAETDFLHEDVLGSDATFSSQKIVYKLLHK